MEYEVFEELVSRDKPTEGNEVSSPYLTPGGELPQPDCGLHVAEPVPLTLNILALCVRHLNL